MRVILDYIFDWLPFGFGVPILIGVGFALLADEFKAFRAARVCFYLATTWMYGKVFMWAYLTSDRFHTRAVVAFLVFGFVGVGLIEALRLTRHREINSTSVPPATEPKPNTENHGTTDSVRVKPEHHGTEERATAKVEHPTKKSAPKSQPQTSIIQTQAPYGNLAPRCNGLGDAIIRFAEQRNHIKPTDPAAHQLGYWEWFRLNDGQFRAHFYDDSKALQKDLAAVNIKDRRLDELIERHERYFVDRNRQPVQTVIDGSMMFHLSLEEIQEIGERFKFLATQVPH